MDTDWYEQRKTTINTDATKLPDTKQHQCLEPLTSVVAVRDCQEGGNTHTGHQQQGMTHKSSLPTADALGPVAMMIQPVPVAAGGQEQAQQSFLIIQATDGRRHLAYYILMYHH